MENNLYLQGLIDALVATKGESDVQLIQWKIEQLIQLQTKKDISDE